MKNSSDKSLSPAAKVIMVTKILFSSAAKRYPLFFLLEALRTIIGIVQPFLAIFVSPLIVDELMGDRDLQKLITLAAALIFGEFILAVLEQFLSMNLQKYQLRLDNHFSTLLGEHCMQLDYPLTEKKEALDQFEKARTGMAWYSGGAYGVAEQLFGLIRNGIKIAGFVTIIALRAPILLAVMTAYVIINTLLTIKRNKIEVQAFGELSKVNRLFGYFGWNIVDPRYGKDIRLYEARDLMVGAWEQNTERSSYHWKWQADSTFPYSLASDALSILRSVFAYFYVGLLALRGQYSIGTFTQLVAAEGSLDASLGGIVQNMTELVKRCNYAYEFVAFMEYPEAMPKGDAPIAKVDHEIEFRDVSFAYPGTEKKVLSHVSIKIRPGEHLSVVGLNGAGKTTFIKLLCRLYDPTEGEILVDGRNVMEYDYGQYMEQFAPVFQDFKLFALSLGENISLRSTDKGDRVDELIRTVGLTDMFAKLSKGKDTAMFKFFDEEGVEPSGGEQQKIAIARALYKDSPIVILDEPTAALDPMAEYEIYNQFHHLVGGKTAVYISHRLSSCRFCDKIAVFSEGTIKEYGNHDELVAIPEGIYARMFEAQAKYYR